MMELANTVTKLLASNDYDAAQKLVATQQDPSQIALGESLLALHRRDSAAAIRHAAQAVGFGAGATAHQYLATSYLAAGDAPRALAHARNAVALDPNVCTRRGLAATLHAVGHGQEAASILRQLVVEVHDDADTHLLLGDVSSALFDHATAIIHYARALDLRPTDPRPIEGLCAMFADVGKWLGALAAVDITKQRKPPPDIAVALNLVTLRLIQRVIGAFPDAGVAREADAAVDATARAATQRGPAMQLAAARALVDFGRLDAAARLVDEARATTDSAERANVRYLDGVLAQRSGDHVAALVAYDDALAHDPRRVDAAINATSLLLANGSAGSLARIGEVLAKVDAEARAASPELLFNEAIWCVRCNQPAEATRVLDRVLVVTNGQGKMGELASRALEELS
jgi:tetratricopeptide (TPR) repeat protein